MTEPDMAGVARRPTSEGSLARGVAPLTAGTLVVQAIGGGITVSAGDGRTIVFGRQADEVHVCVGRDDPGVSRTHGLLTCHGDRWWVHNVGRRPIRLPSGELFTNAEPVPLAPGYTPAFVAGLQGRQHLVELYVAGPDGDRRQARPDMDTVLPTAWPLAPDEVLVTVVLGQRYLRHEPNPQPLSWQDAAAELQLVDPDGGWTSKRVEHKVARLRQRLSSRGVYGLVTGEVSRPVGNQLNDNLIRELVTSATLMPTDLHRIDR